MTVSTTISADGTTIAYETIGSGPSLVLVDGAMCFRDFGPCRSMAEHLADRFAVTFYDRRGRGVSSDTQPYSPEREIDDLAAVLAAVGGTPDVLGYSSGAALALRSAAAGAPMRRVAAYEPPWIGAPAVDHLAELTARLQRGDRRGAVAYFMVDMVGGPAFLPLMMRLMPKVSRQLGAVAHTLPYDTRIMTGFVVPADELSRIHIPALVMSGSKAKQNMASGVAQAASAIAGSVHRVLPGQTHQVKDEALAPVLIEFLS